MGNNKILKSTMCVVLLTIALLSFKSNSTNFHLLETPPPYSGGPAKNGAGDRTGSPLSNGNGECSQCHSGGNFLPNIDIEVIDDNGFVINSYIPGETYTLKFNVSASTGSPVGYGFQGVALSSNIENKQAGLMLKTISSNTRITNLNQISYTEQSGINRSGLFETEWQAPEKGFGEINIYARGLAVNGTSSSGDQQTNAKSILLTENLSTSINDLDVKKLNFVVFPNPNNGDFSIKFNKVEKIIEIKISDVSGKLLTSKKFNTTNFVNLKINKPKGLYILEVITNDGNKTITVKKN